MKKSSSFQLSASWWRAEGPECLGSGKDLEKALAAYEAAQKQLDKSPDAKALDAVERQLDEIDALARKLVGEAEKLLKSPPKDPKKAKFDADEVQFTIDALKKAGKLTDAARQSAQKLAEAEADEDESDDEEDKSVLGDEKAYRAYLTRLLKMAAKDTMFYAIALAKKPGESRMLLHRTRSGKSLAATLRKQTDLKKIAFGECVADADDPTTLQMLIEGTPVSGLGRSTERLFHAFKPQPFKKVVLFAGGEVIEDAIDPDDLPDEYQAIKAELYPALSAAVRQPVHFKDEIVEKMGLADKAANAKDFAEGIRLYEELRELLENPPPAPTQPTQTSARTPLQSNEDKLLAFNERLKALMPQLKSVAGTPAGDAARLKLSEGGVFARKQDFDTANALLDEAEQLLKSAPVGDTPQDAPKVDASAAFNERLKALLPRIKDAAGQPGGEDARLKASEAGVFARKQDFDQAHALLDEVEQLLAAPVEPPAPETRQRTDAGVEITERLKGLMPRLKELAGTPQGDELRLMLSEAGVFARKKEFDQAGALLDRAEQLLAGESTATPEESKTTAPTGEVDPDELRQRWDAARKDLSVAVERSIGQLEALARVLLATEDQNLQWVAEEGISQVAGLLRAGLSDVERATSKSPATLAERAGPAVAGFRRQLNDARVKACDDNEFGVTVAVASTVGGALTALESVLDSLATA
ncbi:hypothetical protein KAK07_13280 [Ideonella sp. 4Y16]|uniref:hypothetical protein n=1 Tax=Ideonella alba TaxID=2824118 RepID=UPI001B35AA55|nr:hypothetical protein [Ideonella alba]MBQ0944310.1 hypothetical protein [Ideonella alba]